MQSIIKAVLDIKQFKFSLDDDLVDRLNRQYTAAVLVIMAVLVSARQYFGKAIHCWCPEARHPIVIVTIALGAGLPIFKKQGSVIGLCKPGYCGQYFGQAMHCWCPEVCATNHEEYANIYCWVDDTYYVPFEDKMPQGEEGRDRKITYYQWVPIILMLEAMMFLAPYAIWRILNSRSGIDLAVIVEAAVASQQSTYSDQRDKMLRYAVHLLDRYLLAQRDPRTGCLANARQVLSKYCILASGKMHGNYLTFCYLVVKIIYAVNAVGQLFLLDVFLGYDFHVLGFQVVRHLLYGDEWTPSQRFPRVSMCDFKIRQNTNVHRYTVQCVLPINIFNEKIFTIVWFWLCLVGVITVLGLFNWLCQIVYWPTQYRYVRRQLNVIGVTLVDFRPDTAEMKRFADVYLRRDGLFVLRLVAKNAGELVASELLSGLWNAFSIKHRQTMMAACAAMTLRPSRKAPKASKDGSGSQQGQAMTYGVDMAGSPRLEEV